MSLGSTRASVARRVARPAGDDMHMGDESEI
jgi:hypothetical protein